MSNTNALAVTVCKFPILQPQEHEDESTVEQGHVSIELPSTEFQSWLHGFSRDHSAPTAHVFLAIWALILKTFTGNEAICAASVLGNTQPNLITTVVNEEATILDLIRSFAAGPRQIQDVTATPPCNSAVYFASTREEITRNLNQVSLAYIYISKGRKLTKLVRSIPAGGG